MERDYSLLIIGYGASLLQLAPIVKHLKNENPKVEISLLTDMLGNIPDAIRDNVSEILPVFSYSGKIKSPKLRGRLEKAFFLFSFVRLVFRRYDIVNMHFAKSWLYYALPCLKRMTRQIVITPWGSDVLRLEGEKNLKKMQKIYGEAKYITVNPETYLAETIVKKFNCNPKKIYPLEFGMDYVDYLIEAKPDKTVEEAKGRFGLKDGYVITCGYSTAPSHRHEAIVDAIYSMKENLPNNLVLLFPFTYSWGTKEYTQGLKDKCIMLGLKSVFVEEFLNDEDLYMLRLATDMFVNVQTTDAGAASVMQYILCKKKIVSGTWLKYYTMEKYTPLFYFPVNTMEELGESILKAYQSEEIKMSQDLIDYIMSRGWKSEIKEWNDFFVSIV